MKDLRVFIFQQRNWALNFGHTLAVYLKKNYNARFACFTQKKNVDLFIRNQKEINYEHIINYEDLLARPSENETYNPKVIEDFCETTGVNSIWKFLLSDKLLTMNYSKQFHYSMFEKNVSNEYIKSFFCQLYLELKQIFTTFNPNIIIMPNMAGSSHVVTYHLAKKKNIKVITVNDTKVAGIYSIVHDPNNSDGYFINHLKNSKNKKKNHKNLNLARKYIKESRSSIKTFAYMDQVQPPISITNLLRDIKNISREIVAYFIYNKSFKIHKIKGVGINHDYRPPKILIRDFISLTINRFKSMRIKYDNIDDLKNFAYYPLQYQPEVTTELQGPWCANQFEIIRMTALSLPADMKLVVKEHPIMIGLRDYTEYKKIKNLLNVYLVNPFTNQNKLLNKAKVVINSNGSIIAESAFCKVPVVQLGMVGILHELPNVIFNSDISNLDESINQAIKININSKEYDKKLENYVKSAFDAGFSCDWDKIWEEKSFNESEILNIINEAIQKELKRQNEQK